jgi:hypothetical protein
MRCWWRGWFFGVPLDKKPGSNLARGLGVKLELSFVVLGTALLEDQQAIVDADACPLVSPLDKYRMVWL